MNNLRNIFQRYEAAVFFDTETTGLDAKSCRIIAAYKLEDKVKNSHRAIDDVEALLEVCKAMDNERADLLSYVNVFGYNPKYGVTGDRLPRVTYWPQHFNDYMQSPHYTLPARVKRRR